MGIADSEVVWGDAGIRAARIETVRELGEEADIRRMVDLGEPTEKDVGLDLITGLGHVARMLARRVSRVDAFDPDPEMLRESESLAREEGIENISFINGSLASLPCEADCYDIVTARMAIRHLSEGSVLVREANRVLKPGGRLLIADALAPLRPELTDFLKFLMELRDRSHVRSYQLAELEILLENGGFDIDLIEIYPKEHDFDSWAKKMGADDDRIRMIAKHIQSASTHVKRHFQVVEKGKKLISFVTWMILIRARPAGN